MNHKLKAVELFNNGYNCSQAVFCAYSEELGLDNEMALKISSSFGAGMGMLRDTCGAVTGGFAVAGALFGYSDIKDDEAKKAHYALIRRIAEDFNKLNDTYICRELLAGLKNVSSTTPGVRTAEYYSERPCAKFVADVCDILDKIIEERA